MKDIEMWRKKRSGAKKTLARRRVQEEGGRGRRTERRPLVQKKSANSGGCIGWRVN